MFSIDFTSRIPIYEQIYKKIIELIIKGSLHENDRIPSVRTFAKDTGVNPNTVSKAYQELERNGIIYSIPGRGCFIAKPESGAFRSAAFADFDKSVLDALKRGISADELKERIDDIQGRGSVQ